jgi:hypothetical protein
MHPGLADEIDRLEQEVSSLSTDPERLRVLVNSSHDCVRAAVAENIATPIDSLQKMIDDPDSWVLHNLASNPNTPEETLFDLLSRGANVETSITKANCRMIDSRCLRAFKFNRSRCEKTTINFFATRFRTRREYLAL